MRNLFKNFDYYYVVGIITSVLLFPIKLLLDFAREIMMHLSNMTGRFTDYTSAYSVMYFLVIGLVVILSYAGINSDFDVLYGGFMLSTGNESWSYSMAIVTAIAIGVGLFITTSNITNILAFGKHKATHKKYMDHRIQLFLNVLVFIGCGYSTIQLSANSEKALKNRSSDLFAQLDDKKTQLEKQKNNRISSEIIALDDAFSRDSMFLSGQAQSAAGAATKNERAAVKDLQGKIRILQSKKAANWGEKQWVKTEVMKHEKQINILQEVIISKESPIWENFNARMLAKSEQYSKKRDSIAQAISISFAGNESQHKDEYDRLKLDVMDAGTIFKYRNIFFNVGVVLLTLMLSLYFKGAKEENADPSPAKTATIKKTKTKTGGNAGNGTTDPMPDQKGVMVINYKDLSPLCKRARRRFELSKISAKDDTKAANLVKALSDIKVLAELGFSVAIQDGKLSVLDEQGAGNVSSEVTELLYQYREDVSAYQSENKERDFEKYNI